jgi:hypothetical protein
MGRGLWLSAANCTSVPLISRQPAFTLVDQVECFGLFKAETVFVSMALASSTVPDCWVGAAVAKMPAPTINAMADADCSFSFGAICVVDWGPSLHRSGNRLYR